jgi:hypothetical protein
MKATATRLRDRISWKEHPLLTGVVSSVLAAGVVYVLTLVPSLRAPIFHALSVVQRILGTSVQIPLWAALLLVVASPFFMVAFRRLRGRTEIRDDADIRTLLSAWVNRNSHKFAAAIEFTEVDRQLKIPSGSAKRYLTQEAAKLRYLPKSEGPNTLLLEYQPQTYPRRSGPRF